MEKIDCHILFDQIPAEFSKGEKILVVQYEFSGIQRYLFGSGDISMTEDQLHRHSRHVEMLTVQLHRCLAEAFPKQACRVLSISSGKLICAFSKKTDKQKLQQLSEDYQKRVYAATAGMLELYWGMALAVVCRQTKPKCRQDVTAALAGQIQKQKFHCTGLLGASLTAQDESLLAQNLVCEEFPLPRRTGSGIAIKCDLDNLGLFFGQLRAFDTRKAASAALKSVLEGALDDYIYIGGDDIFAVVPLEKGLHTLADMYRRICLGIDTSRELAPYRPHFGISGGVSAVEFFDGKLPLVYYLDSSEQQLTQAKEHPGKNCVCYENKILTWQQVALLDKCLAIYGEKLFPGGSGAALRACLRDPGYLAQQLLYLPALRAELSREEVACLERIL